MESGIPTLTLHANSSDSAEVINKFRNICLTKNLKRGDVLLKLVKAFNDDSSEMHCDSSILVLFTAYCDENKLNLKSELNILIYSKLESENYFSKYK